MLSIWCYCRHGRRILYILFSFYSLSYGWWRPFARRSHHIRALSGWPTGSQWRTGPKV